MVYLLFQIKDLGFGRRFGKQDTLTMETRNLQVYRDENYSQLINKIGSFERTDTWVNEIKGVRTMFDKRLLFVLLGFKLDPNFTFRVYVDKAPDWLCVKPNYYGEERGDEKWLDFAHYGALFIPKTHTLSNDASTEAIRLKELINHYTNTIGIETKEKLERVCQLVENDQIFKDYKKRLSDRQLIELSMQKQQLATELQNEREENAALQQEVVRLQNELTVERKEVKKTLNTTKKLWERQIKEITEEKDKKIAELGTEKIKNSNLQEKYSFYKDFFDNYLRNTKTEINELKSELNKEELEWLDIYCEASQETEKSSFVEKQLTRAKDNLKGKLSERELKLILEKQIEINELESQLNNLQIQEDNQEQSSLQAQIQQPPK